MDEPRDRGRRTFVALSGATLAAAAIGTSLEAQQAVAGQARPASAPAGFTAAEWRTLDAVVARIIPSESGSPGAREIGVMDFISRQLPHHMKELAAPLRAWLAELDRATVEHHPAIKAFIALPAADQDSLLREFEHSDPATGTSDAERQRLGLRSGIFGALVQVTISGALSDPRYGGNRRGLGFRLIGFTSRHSWSPPYGEIDRG